MLLSDVSVKRPTIAIVLSLLLCVFGYVSFSKLSVREMPDISSPIVSIWTTYQGASANIMESQVTTVLESQLSGISGVEDVSSVSRNGSSQITITFEIGYDLVVGVSDVRDAIARAQRQLPDEADDPIVSKANSSSDSVLHLTLSSTQMDRIQLTDYANRVLVDRFNLISGVSSIRISGGLEKVMYIKLDPQAMAGLGVTTSDIKTALNNENIENPSGEIRNDISSMTVRTTRNYLTEEDFRYLVVKKTNDNDPIYLQDVANVYLGAKNDSTLYKNNGVMSVNMGIIAQSDANPLDVAALARAEAENIQKFLPEGTELRINYDETIFISKSISEVYSTLFITGGFVILVLYIFLGQARATLIPALTVPVSLISAFMAAYFFGFSINLITLLALILAIGLVVDDAIVVVENIFHHLEQGEPPLLAAYKGAREVGFAVVATTLVLTMVFLPISFMDGMVGLLFTEFAVLLAMSVIFSSLIALTLTPALSSKLLKNQNKKSRFNTFIDGVFDKMEACYRNMLTYLMRFRWMAPISIILCITGSVLLSNQVPNELAPVEDKGVLVAFVKGADASSFDRMSDNIEQVEDRLMSLLGKGVLQSFNIDAPAFGGIAGDETALLIMVLEDWEERTVTAQEALVQIRTLLSDIPDIRVRIRMPGFGGGSDEPVQFVLSGSDYDELLHWAEYLQEQAEQDGMILDGQLNYSEKTPELVVTVDKQRASELGISVTEVAETLEVMLGGTSETTYLERGEEYDVYLRGDENNFNSAADLSKIYLRTDSGQLITLDTVTNIQEVASAGRLAHTNKQKSITLSASVGEDQTLGEVLDYLDQKAIDELPHDLSFSYSGESKDFKENQSSTMIIFALALLVSYLVLAAQFESFINPLVIMLTVPMGVFGGFMGLLLMGQGFNLYSQIGMIMLIGMVTKNGILIVEFANQLRDKGLEFEKAIIDASTRRLRPILMTAFTTIAGSLPLILSTGAGYESRVSVGTVVLFGMSFATVVSLFVIPQMYRLISQRTHSPGYVAAILEKELAQHPKTRKDHGSF